VPEKWLRRQKPRYVNFRKNAGVSPIPSDYVEPLYQGVETTGNVISSYFHFSVLKWQKLETYPF
jgi:hypothetical protein